MRAHCRRIDRIFLMALVLLLLTVARGGAEWSPGRGRIWVGPPANPERYARFATDNGIPGSGHYAYFDYNWPSLRQALDQYGWFGRRYREQTSLSRPRVYGFGDQ